MLFNSLEFVVFFPIVVFFYFLIPFRFRWVWLLFASYVFYMSWNPAYIVLIIISTVVDYLAGLGMGNTNNQPTKNGFLLLSLFTNLSILFFFKYYNFFEQALVNAGTIFDLTISLPDLNVVLPVGISFYTFQTLSYTIDVYTEKRDPETHFGQFALYVSFFPQLVAGPIERSTRLLPQFKEEYSLDLNRVIDGLKLMLWGLFKKIVIADRLAILVDQIYANPTSYEGLTAIVATYFFSFQIFCDFSGYSDIAIGAAKVLGYDLMENFARPYFSKSIPEFWRRWHISLSTWFRDYLYIPLGGNKTALFRKYYNIFIVFVVSGLWHGANWTFVIWGAFHGFFYLVSDWKKKLFTFLIGSEDLNLFGPLQKYIDMFITFHLVTFSWILFRADTIEDASIIIMGLFPGWGTLFNQISQFPALINSGELGLGEFDFLIAVTSIIFLLMIHFLQRRGDMRHFLVDYPLWFRWTIYYILILGCCFLGVFSEEAFIYFQF